MKEVLQPFSNLISIYNKQEHHHVLLNWEIHRKPNYPINARAEQMLYMNGYTHKSHNHNTIKAGRYIRKKV